MKLPSFFQNKTRIAGLLLIVGLIIKIFTILTIHPVTFLIDLGISSLLIGAGIIVFLISVFSS